MLKRRPSVRDLVAFWIFGLANNFAYTVMLSAAEDIVGRQTGAAPQPRNGTGCLADLGAPRCDKLMSTGAVLLAAIVPALLLKCVLPFWANRLPFGFRHWLVCSLQTLSYLLVAFSPSLPVSLLGVVFASAGFGLGEMCYLALSAHYPESHNPGHLCDCVSLETSIPVGVVPHRYWLVLSPSPSVHKMRLLDPSTWVVPAKRDCDSVAAEAACTHEFALSTKIRGILPLAHWMGPLCAVYVSEYLINAGLHQLIRFDCAHGLGLSPRSQFRWFQTLYHLGVLASRSSVALFRLPTEALYLLPFLQFALLAFFYVQAVHRLVPHILIVFALILAEGLFGGAAYANTFHKIHKTSRPELREFNMSIGSLADSAGIALAGLLAIWVHNHICLLFPQTEESMWHLGIGNK